jgi:hypothetical protein
MSTINTNPINVNYPVPGINNNSQGFRDNFQNIKLNLDAAASEITDLQNKAVLKAALANTAGFINNDMANTLISNASTRSFRSTTYNLGNALSGTVLVNASLADVFYGNVSNNVTLQFGSWAPTDTQQIIYLQLGKPVANPGDDTNYNINFPPEAVYDNNNYGLTILQNYNNNGSISFPYDISLLNLKISTVDCGNTLYIEPVNRSAQSSQIQTRTPPPTGQLGDVSGTVCVDQAVTQLTITNTDAATDILTTANTASLYSGMPVIFTGSVFGGILDTSTYYVRNVVSSTSFTVSSSTSLSSNVTLSTATGNMYSNPVTYMYIAVDNYSANSTNYSISETIAPNTIILSNAGVVTSSISVNQPIIFTGLDETNITDIGVASNTVYYVKSTNGPNNSITISQTRYNGVAGPEFQDIANASASPNIFIPDMTVYNGNDIFRRIELKPW